MNRVAAALESECLFITGATGFLGTVLVEKLLWSIPEVGSLVLLLRERSDRSATERLRDEVIGSPVMARLRARHGADWPRWAASKLEAVGGDLAFERFGLDVEAYARLATNVDRVVANAATVTFDERLDRALATNADGAVRTLQLAKDAGDAPLLHVSTCFVSGQRQGDIEETVVGAEALDETLVHPDLLAMVERLHVRGETRDAPWVEAGAEMAGRYGFHDVYTLTKALGERLIDRHRDRVPAAILRPAIVESAVAEPFPGWIDGVRVSDPLLVAYGRGRARALPGNPDAPMPLVPVDHVVNAAIVALARLERRHDDQPRPESVPEPIPVYQVASARHPITLGSLMEFARDGFGTTPLRNEAGAAIDVPEARFVAPASYRADLERNRRRVRTLMRLVPRRRTSKARLALGSTARTLDHLRHLLDVYQPYLDHGAHYDDQRVRALWADLPEDAKTAFPFDVTTLDWSRYIADIHVPGLIRYALRAESGAPDASTSSPAPSAEAILAKAHDQAVAATTLDRLFMDVAAAHPDAVAFQVYRDGRWLRYRYREARDSTANIAFQLRERYGIGPGDRVVLWSNGRPEWALVALATWRLGATIVPIDPQWPAAELAEGARFVDAKLICVAPQLASTIEDGAINVGCPVVRLDASLVSAPEVGLLPGADALEAVARPHDLASVIFTSGTTVAPKAVPLTHANYLANVRDLIPLMKLTRDRLVSVLPMHHVFEQMVGWLVPMSGGSTFSYVAEIKPAEISWVMMTTKPTVLVAVPRLLELLHGGIMANVAAGGPMLRMLFKVLFGLSRRSDGARGHELFKKVHQRFGGALRRIATGGSALDPALGRSFQLMGFQVAEGYGMTETSPVLTVNPWKAIRFGSVGRPLPGVEIDLRPIDNDTADAGRDTGLDAGLDTGSGEIWVRGANVMDGYLNDPDATSRCRVGGWLNTGDIGSFDDDGYLHISGRTKDVIVTGAGKNIYPEEVESRFAGVDGVAELVALGLPADGQPQRGAEKLVAVVVPASGAEESEIRDALAARARSVPSFQQPSGVEIWRGELPKTTTMKVKRAVLRDAILAGERGREVEPIPAPAAPVRTGDQAVMIELLARVARTRADQVRDLDRLSDLGVDSLTRVELVGALEARFGVEVDDETAAGIERVADLYALASHSASRDRSAA